MIAVPTFLAAGLLVVSFSLNDAWTGGQLGWNRLTKDHGGVLGGRPIYYSALPHLALCYLLGGLEALAIGLVWGIYRAGFGFPTGTLTGERRLQTFLRHAMIVVPMEVVSICFGQAAWAFMAWWLYALAATGLAVWSGKQAHDGDGVDENAIVEATRGALFGAAAAVVLLAGG